MSQQRPWLSTYAELGQQWEQIPPLPEKTLSDYVRDHGARYGDRIALAYLGVSITYRQLDQLVDRLANGLQAQGIGPGSVMAIQLPNVPQYVVAMTAAARLGVVLTSLSPLLTPREAIAQCEDAQVNVLLTLDALYEAMGEKLAEAVPTLKLILVSTATELMPNLPKATPNPVGVERVRVQGLDALLQAASVEPVRVPVSIDKILYLQYTGGTTGKAKGAQLTSRNIFINNVQANVFYGYREGMETVASAFPFFHIGGAAVLLNAIRTASTFLVIPDPRNMEQFCGAMKMHPPTVLAGVPALFQMLMASDSFRSLDFSGLRMAISGAAPFAEEEIKRLETIIGKNRFCEVYGMTETAPVQTLNPANKFKPGFVGVPLPGTDLLIVDAETGLDPMPLGEPGEVIVSGPQVMQGYLAAPDANAKALRERDGKIWMYTGDIGFLDQDGYLKICDRSKDMLIVGGYKVFSVEVETKLAEVPFVAMSAVVGKPDTARPGNDIVQLYVQVRPGTTLSEAEMREALTSFCRSNMAPYKVPKEIHFVDAIPLTSVGKIDKKALRPAA